MLILRQPAWAPARVALVASVLVAGYFVIFDAGQYLHSITAEVYGRFWPMRNWMLVHIASGSVALIAGAIQFLLAFLRRTSILHRWTGRIYVVAVLGSCAASLVVLRNGSVVGPAWVALLVTLSIYVSIFTTCGLLAACRREWHQHAKWMIRSYMGMMVFAWFRVAWELPLMTGMPRGTRAAVILGLTMLLTSLGAELALCRLRRPQGERKGA